jgi:DNA-binding transcriptional MerR regulator
MGTIEECAKHLGVQPRTIKFYTTPTYQRRIEKRKNPKDYTIVIRLEDE